MKKILLGLIGLLFAVPGWADGLPAGYTELQYIQSTGSQYIDTGIVFDSGSLKFEADVYTTANLSAEEDFIGNFTRASTSVGFVGGFFTGVTFLYSSPINVNVPRIITNSWQKYIGEFTSDNQMILTYDGTTVSDTRTKQHNSSPIVLFRGSASYKPAEHIRLGIVSIYLNNTMVRNFVPAKNSSGVVGMYDTVSGTFFTNAGTGTFTAGPVVPEQQIRIATTAYNSARFSPVVTELNDTIATIRDVVTNTINQTAAIADLQATKQTRPNENCPAGKKCLLVEDNDGTPHWFEIVESAD